VEGEMNIFVVHNDPDEAAKMLCDKHVVKMTLESAQLLCSQFEPGTAPYKRAMYNHPCSIWCRETVANYLWLCYHGLALADEYCYRYDKIHSCHDVIYWCYERVMDGDLDLPFGELTPFAQAMPEKYKNVNPVKAYRAYYLGDKARFAKWTKRKPPKWWK
jgi:hypothetical protein